MAYKVITKSYCPICKNKLEAFSGVFSIDKPFLQCKYCDQIIIATKTRNEWELISSSEKKFLIFLSIFQFLAINAIFIFMTFIISYMTHLNENKNFNIFMILVSIAIIFIVPFLTIIPFYKTIIASKNRMKDIKYRDVLKKYGII